MASFDPAQWQEVPANEAFEVPAGVLEVRFSQPGALWILGESYEAPSGFGAEHRVEVPPGVRVRAETAGRAFVKLRAGSAFWVDEVSFTNIDRMPVVSGQMEEVLRARREFELFRRRTLAEIRAASRAAVAAVAPASPGEKQPEGEDDELPDATEGGDGGEPSEN